MSQHDVNITLQQMLDHVREAVALSEGKTRSSLDHERLLDLALTRLLEIIGEAANRVPDAVQQAHPEIPWREMISLRNRLIHGYDSIDLDILWRIVKVDLPPLIAMLEKIIR